MLTASIMLDSSAAKSDVRFSWTSPVTSVLMERESSSILSAVSANSKLKESSRSFGEFINSSLIIKIGLCDRPDIDDLLPDATAIRSGVFATNERMLASLSFGPDTNDWPAID